MEQICFALLAFEHVPVPEELVRVAPPRQHLVWEGAEDADDARQHRGQRVILEEDVPGVQLGDDGSKGPQVDFGVVWQSEHNLGGAVGARLRRGRGRGPRAVRKAEGHGLAAAPRSTAASSSPPSGGHKHGKGSLGSLGRGDRFVSREWGASARVLTVSHLDVGGEVVRGETRRAEVDDLDFAAGVGLDQDVLGLEVAVNEAEPVHEDDYSRGWMKPSQPRSSRPYPPNHLGADALLGDFAQPGQREVGLGAGVAVESAKLVQVVAQQLAHDEESYLGSG
eukprot:scaffold9990_cov99-Isochrysis_galbana.AAC.3